MSFPLRVCVLAVCLGLAAVRAEEAFRDDFDSVAGWEARPDWLGAASARPEATCANGVACFRVPEPGRGMKWRCGIEPVDSGPTPWLVIRYRAENCDAATADYLLWLQDGSTGGDGVRLLGRDQARADGQWHTQAFYLPDARVVPPVQALALQSYAGAAGNAALWVDFITVTDDPPPAAEGFTPPPAAHVRLDVDLGDPAAWTVQPSWLANYTTRSTVGQAGAGVRFTVQPPGSGAKWSRNLAEPLRGARWLALRYRTAGLAPGGDYALYVASEPGGKAREEQYIVRLGDLVADGAWHVLAAPLAVSSVQTLAVQVQAAGPDAFVEIAGLCLSDAKPRVSLADVLEYAAGHPPAAAGFQVVPLPPGNTDGVDLGRRLGFDGWFEAGPVTVGGLPFTVRAGADAVALTGAGEVGALDVPLGVTAAEMYLLLAAILPRQEQPGYSGAAGTVRQVERLCARIEYADGTVDEQFPFHVAAAAHQVVRGLAVYALALDPARQARRLELRDGMRRGAFGVVAATVSAAPGPASAATAWQSLPPPAPPAAARAPAQVQPGVRRDGARLLVEGGTVAMELDTTAGLRVERLTSRLAVGPDLEFEPGPLFRVWIDGQQLAPETFRVTGVSDLAAAPGGGTVEITTVCESVQPPVRVTVGIDTGRDGEVGLRARADVGGRDWTAVRLVFPEIGGLRFGPDPAATGYWMPRRGAVVGHLPISLRAPYAGAGNPFQVMGVFAPDGGPGLHLMTQDQEALPKAYLLDKTDGRVRLAVEYAPCATGDLPRTVIGCRLGDWHAQLARCRQWLAEWYRPAAPRKAWFREVFSFRQQFLSFGVPSPSGMFDRSTRTLHLAEVVDREAKAFGGIDYLHLFDWGWDPVHGRCGDYRPWDYLGPPEAFRRAVQQVRDSGVPVGLYIEGYLVDPESDLGKTRAPDWQLLDAAGKPYPYFAPSFNVCSWPRAWQDYLAATYGRAREETGAVGFYIDEYGFSDPSHACWNRGHGHPVPASPVPGEREMTRRVRAAIGPECVLYTEESPTDVNSQYQDGSFTYSISCASDEWNPSHVNLYRFLIPDFKTIEIITCDHPLDDNVEALKRILFNGEAVWLEGLADRWFSPEARDFIARMHRVLRDRRDCFAGDAPTPLVPTLVPGVYANRFAGRVDAARGPVCWTVYNTRYRTVAGDVLVVDHSPAARYLDAFTGTELAARVEENRAWLRLTLAPRDVAVVSRVVQP